MHSLWKTLWTVVGTHPRAGKRNDAEWIMKAGLGCTTGGEAHLG